MKILAILGALSMVGCATPAQNLPTELAPVLADARAHNDVAAIACWEALAMAGELPEAAVADSYVSKVLLDYQKLRDMRIADKPCAAMIVDSGQAALMLWSLVHKIGPAVTLGFP